jgi:hypothetical protein
MCFVGLHFVITLNFMALISQELTHRGDGMHDEGDEHSIWLGLSLSLISLIKEESGSKFPVNAIEQAISQYLQRMHLFLLIEI